MSLCLTPKISTSTKSKWRRIVRPSISSEATKSKARNVYGPDGQKVGYIERVMIDKVSGKVSHEVLSFGCLFGIGDDHYPLP